MHHGYDSTLARIQRMKCVAGRCLVPVQDDYELHVSVPRKKNVTLKYLQLGFVQIDCMLCSMVNHH